MPECSATELVVPALEIIDYRTETPRAIAGTIADNAAFGAIVVVGRTVRRDGPSGGGRSLDRRDCARKWRIRPRERAWGPIDGLQQQCIRDRGFALVEEAELEWVFSRERAPRLLMLNRIDQGPIGRVLPRARHVAERVQCRNPAARCPRDSGFRAPRWAAVAARAISGHYR